MEQRTYPGEISLISWSTRARSRLSSPVHRQCRLRGQLPSRRHSLGYCLSPASKYEWPPSSPVFSFCHLLSIGMVTGLGIKTPFDYSVFSAAAAAFLLAFWEPDRFTLDKLLNRLRN